MFNSCIKVAHTNLAIFTMHEDETAILDFVQNMEYKFVELMSCLFIKSDDIVVKSHVTYRYNAMKQRQQTSQTKHDELYKVVRMKNPSLLLQFQHDSPLRSVGSNELN